MINGMNVLTLHATNPGEVTWGMEGGNSTGMDGDLLVEWGEIVVRMLIADKFLN